MGKLRVVLLALGRRGGVATYALEIARALSPKVDLLVIVSRQAEAIDMWREERFRLLEVDTYADKASSLLWSLDVSRFLTMRREILGFQPDVLYYPMLHFWIPILNLLIPSVPKVITIHDPVLHLGEESLLGTVLKNVSIKQASRLVVLSTVFVHNLEKAGLESEQIDVIPLGEFSYYRAFSPDTDMAYADSPSLLFFGRILPYKGLGVLLRAFGQIQEAIPDATLLIVGNGDLGGNRGLLDSLANVEVINQWIPDTGVAAYFRRARLVVLPYLVASQSGVIPLAYSFRLPVVATNVGGLKEQVVHGKTGFLVDPGDSSEIARVCIDLLRDPALCERLGNAGFELASSQWNWDRISSMVLQSCQKAVVTE